MLVAHTAHRPIRVVLAILACVALSLAAACSAALARQDVSRVLTFEAADAMDRLHPRPAETAFLDSTVVHEGRHALRVQRDSTSHDDFTIAWLVIPVDFKGDTVEVRGWVRYRGVAGSVGLVQRQDGPDGLMVLDDMASRNLRGDSDWTELVSRQSLRTGARKLRVGAMLVGAGTLWVDDVRVLIDGAPFARVPVDSSRLTPLDLDHEFDAGSRFTLEHPSRTQVEDLALLGRVWGFLKYHHPAVVGGHRHWDYDLFRVLPAVAAAPSPAACRRVLAVWIDTLPPVPVPDTLAVLPPDSALALAPDLAWLKDASVVGDTLGAQLRTIYARRPNVRRQYFVYP